MRLLIDTHVLIWFCEGNPALSATVRAAMEDEANERFISHAVPWEIAIKLSLGKLRLQTDYDVIFPRRARCEWIPNAGRESRTLSCARHSAAAPRRSI